MSRYSKELAVAEAAARAAGAVLLEFFQRDIGVEHKEGGEPVTEADRASELLIIERVRREFPQDGVLSEEQDDKQSWARCDRAWIIDPMDGTRDFIAGREGFSVLIGLVQGGQPVVGVVYQPLTDRLYRASAGERAELTVQGKTALVRCSAVADPSQARLVSSRSQRSRQIEGAKLALGISDEHRMGSAGLKIAAVAAAERDLYLLPHGDCKLWDSCAAEAVLTAAGGRISDLWGRPLTYSDPQRVRLSDGIVATNGRLHDEVLRRIGPELRAAKPPSSHL